MSAEGATLREVIERLDDDRAGLTFIGNGERTVISFAELHRRGDEITAKLLGAAVAPGDRVILAIPDQAAFVQLFLGVSNAGLVPVPIYPPFILGELDAYFENLRRLIRVTGSELLICGPELLDLLGPLAGDVRISTLADLEPGPPRPTPTIGEDDIAFLQFTSGSTAAPKGVVVTQRSLMANVSAIAAHLDDGDGGRHDHGVSWLPMYHDMGLIGQLMVALCRQVSGTYLAPLDFVRRPTSWLELIERGRRHGQLRPQLRLLAGRPARHRRGDRDLGPLWLAGRRLRRRADPRRLPAPVRRAVCSGRILAVGLHALLRPGRGDARRLPDAARARAQGRAGGERPAARAPRGPRRGGG